MRRLVAVAGILLAGAILVGATLVAIYFSGPEEEFLPGAPRVEISATAPAVAMATPAASPEPAGAEPAENEGFSARLQQETWRVGQTDEDPGKTDRELTAWAQAMTSAELRQLGRAALDIEGEPDQRFLAVDLLGRSGKEEAAEILAGIASEPLAVEFGSDSKSSTPAEFETLLREQAVDSIAELPEAEKTLARVLEKVNRSSIVDRIQRHRAALKAQVPPVKDQERRALSDLLGY